MTNNIILNKFQSKYVRLANPLSLDMQELNCNKNNIFQFSGHYKTFSL